MDRINQEILWKQVYTIYISPSTPSSHPPPSPQPDDVEMTTKKSNASPAPSHVAKQQASITNDDDL